ncbi:hypothetical protein, partial [uncultured Dokdonia sp.]|uniref:hypothetical protein n=1 Tax=uncultured Dokdonia sp. TaxID=575653 RepID=UPI00345004E9
MFKNYIALLAFVCIISCATDDPISEPVANVFDGDVELLTQQDVEDFGAIGYTEITGNLVISSQLDNPDPITSLVSLSTLEIIGDDLSLNPVFEITSLNKAIMKAKMPKNVQTKCLSELKKLKSMSPMSAEATVVRNYLDWMTELPWHKKSEVDIDLTKALNILDKDH